jgi:hypothetical protein
LLRWSSGVLDALARISKFSWIPMSFVSNSDMPIDRTVLTRSQVSAHRILIHGAMVSLTFVKASIGNFNKDMPLLEDIFGDVVQINSDSLKSATRNDAT